MATFDMILSMKRKEYQVHVTVNGRKISKVIIDPHYEIKHSKSINDEVIVDLVKKLDGGEYEPDREFDGFEYFVSDGIELHGKRYKLVWLLEKNQIYIGIVNAYRRK